MRRESAATVMGNIADAWLFGRSLAELAEYETSSGVGDADASSSLERTLIRSGSRRRAGDGAGCLVVRWENQMGGAR